jgi:hypothetical protein
MTKFTIKTWTGHKVNVEIAETKDEFTKRVKEHYKLSIRGTRACCHYSNDEVRDKWIADVLFYKGDLNVGTIAHEMTHATSGLAIKLGWNLNFSKTNENIADNLGKLVGECCKKLSKLGYTIEFDN